jgi:hypothetical protein
LNNFVGFNTSGIADIKDTGYQLQSSMMLVPKTFAGVLRCLADLQRLWRQFGHPGWCELVYDS